MKHSRRVEKETYLKLIHETLIHARLLSLSRLVSNRHGEIGALLKAYE